MRRGARWPLVAILCGAFALRAWHADWGLPFTYHPDEHQYVDSAVAMLGGNLDPGRFTNPTLLKYAYAALFALFARTDRLLAPPGTPDLAAAFAADPSTLYLAARLISALAGTLTVAVAYRLGRRLDGPVAGVAAAALLAGTFLHARDAHFAVGDVATALWVTVALALAARLADDGPARDLWLAAACVGLAAGTKYSAAAAAVPLALAYALRGARPAGQGGRAAAARRAAARLLDGRLALAALVAAGAFLAVVPFALLRPAAFLADLSQLAERGREGFKGLAIDPAPGWIFYLKSLLWGMGLPLLAAALAGLARAVGGRRPAAWVVAALPLTLWAYLGGQLLMFARFMIPALPALAVLAAGALAAAGRALARRRGPLAGRPGAATALLAALVVAPSAGDAARFDLLIGREDTRTAAKAWLEAQLPEGTALLVQSNGPELGDLADPSPPPRTRRRFRLTEIGTMELDERPLEAWRQDGHQILVVSSFSTDRRLLDPAADAAHRAYVDGLSRLPLLAEFAPTERRPPPPFVFAQLYGPATGLYRFTRPGPFIRVYRLDD